MKMNQQPTTTHSCYSACSLPSSSSSSSSPSSSTLSIVSSFLPPSSREPLYGSEFDPFYGGGPAMTTLAPKDPSPFQRPGGPLGRAFDLSRSLCDGFGLVKDPLLDVFGPGFDSITPTLSTTTSTATNSELNRPGQQLMRNQSFEEDAGLQQLDANECRSRDTRMTEGYGGRQPDPEATSGQAISAIQMWSTNWGSASTPFSSSIASEYTGQYYLLLSSSRQLGLYTVVHDGSASLHAAPSVQGSSRVHGLFFNQSIN